MTKFLGTLVVWICFGLFAFPVSAQIIVDRIIALVDDRIITKVAFEETFAPIRERIEAAGYGPEETQALIDRYREDVMNQMIDQTITDIAVEEAGIEISDQEVNQALEDFRMNHNLSPEEFEKALLSEGLTLEVYRNQMREQMLRSRLVNYMVRSRIVITREQIEAFYRENAERFGGGKRYRLAHILIPFPRNMAPETEARLREKTQTLVGYLESGRSFSELAAQESQSTIAGPDGELGWFEAETLSPRIRDAVAGLQRGDFSGPVRTPQGFQIFKLLETGFQNPKPLSEVEDEIADELYDVEVNRRFQIWVTELREKVHVRMLD
ncbi:peptidylprolyl isomerase [Desulfobotulus sp. H1]|uniref:Peptidylprolyl isomerase n=1 Tax=Desulfobotulus pelophilus TaxID=2823377 RepID=A0ABT3NB22_9BACT|nr:peptidylprolyl isomerase [Desulfobotulus pelophilus]MCW7754661.1 peptidylprolyl isomerase [Desulfobotulus pelophilus]